VRIAVIPARGGSKRIPRKNIKSFCGKPIIAWSIAAAHGSGCFDRVIVSTDDAEIAGVARDAGAEVPFESSLAIERELQQQLFQSEDAKEGLAAYVEKRTPNFKGR